MTKYMYILALMILLTSIQSITITSTAQNSDPHYIINVIINEYSFIDDKSIANDYPGYDSTTTDRFYLIHDELIDNGIKLLESPYWVSYFDNHYPYKVNITDSEDISSLNDAISLIKSAKIVMIADTGYSWYVEYDDNTKTLKIHTYIVVNNKLLGYELGYYSYTGTASPDNTDVRVAILVSPFASILYPAHWKTWYETKYKKTVYKVERYTPTGGLYDIDIVIGFDFYPLVINDGEGNIYIYDPGEFPKPLYSIITRRISWILTSKLSVDKMKSPMVHFISSFCDRIYRGDTVVNALNIVLTNNGPLIAPNYIIAYYVLTNDGLGMYKGHNRVGITYGIGGSNSPLVIDPDDPPDDGGGGGVPCYPPGSPYCNIPTSYHKMNEQ